MPVTYQANILDTTYNGWENYETWNVALWINNDECLYHLAMEVGNYVDFIDLLNDQGIVDTPDGVKYNDPKVNAIQLNSDVFDIWLTLSTHTVPNTQIQMFSNVINKVRTFGYTMKNPIPRKIFFLYHFAPKRYTQFRDLMYTLNTDYQQGLITEEQFDSALLAFWLHLLNIT